VAVRGARGAPSARAGRGQHFLASRTLAAALVDDAAVARGELVVDLGAGRGIITAELAARGARVHAVESDPALAAVLRRRFERAPLVTVVEADARMLAPPEEPFAVVANLPFAGAIEILRRLLDDPRVPLARAVVVLQWEAAAKLAAVWPSTLRAAYWGAWYELSLVRRLARDAFAPPPSVAAGVVRIVRRKQPLVPPTFAPRYRAFLRHGFAHGPGSVVSRGALVEASRRLGFGRTPRARDLGAPQWATLYAPVRPPSAHGWPVATRRQASR
jgi:23S rRNA (adenine-N6)-dimethyltransferase